VCVGNIQPEYSDKDLPFIETGTLTQNSVSLALNICITETEAIFNLWVHLTIPGIQPMRIVERKERIQLGSNYSGA
jgi:hypothetical protein